MPQSVTKWLFALLCLGVVGSIQAQSPDDLIDQGINKVEKKDFREALDLFKKAVDMENDNAKAVNSLGIGYLKLNLLDSAAFCFLRAMDLDEHYHNAYYNLGLCYREQQKPDQAMALFQRYMQYKPNDPEVYNEVAMIFQNWKKNDSALYYFNRSLELDSLNANTYYMKARFHYLLDDYEQALTTINKSIDLRKDIPEAFALRGYIYEDLYEYPKALADYNQTLALDPDDIETLEDRAALHLSMELNGAAIEDALALMKHLPNDIRPLYILSNAYLNADSIDKAMYYADQGLDLDPEISQFMTLKGKIYLKQGDYGKALDQLEKAILLNPKSGTNYNYKVDARILQGLDQQRVSMSNGKVRFKEIESNNIDNMDSWVNDENSPYYYPNLIKKSKQDYHAFGLDEYYMLYYGYTQQDGYSPYSRSDDDVEDSLYSLLKEKRFRDCIKGGQSFLDHHPHSADAHLYVAYAYYAMDEMEKYEEYLYRYRALIKSIMATGDGNSFETAWVVTSTKDEYMVIDFLGYRTNGQSLHHNDGHSFDVLHCNNPSGEQRDFYFNIDKPFGSLGDLFEQDSKKDKKKKKKRK